MKKEISSFGRGIVLSCGGMLIGLGFGISLGVGIAGYLQASVQCQFFQNIVHMALHGVGGDVEPLGNFLIAQAFRNQFNHLAFPLRHPHRLNQVYLALSDHSVQRFGKRAIRSRKVEEHSLPPPPIVWFLAKSSKVRVFQDEAGNPFFYELDDICLHGDEIHHDHFDLGRLFLDQFHQA